MGLAVTNLRVVCKIITCISAFTEMAIILLKIVLKKLLLVGTLCVAGYANDAIVGACLRTSDMQEHKIIWHAGPEQDTIFHLRVIACREQGSHCHDEQSAWFSFTGAGDFVLQPIRLESLGSELQESCKLCSCGSPWPCTLTRNNL